MDFQKPSSSRPGWASATLGLAVAAGLCTYHQYLIRGRDGEACLRTFRRSYWLGAAVFTGIWTDFLLRR